MNIYLVSCRFVGNRLDTWQPTMTFPIQSSSLSSTCAYCCLGRSRGTNASARGTLFDPLPCHSANWCCIRNCWWRTASWPPLVQSQTSPVSRFMLSQTIWAHFASRTRAHGRAQMADGWWLRRYSCGTGISGCREWCRCRKWLHCPVSDSYSISNI